LCLSGFFDSDDHVFFADEGKIPFGVVERTDILCAGVGGDAGDPFMVGFVAVVVYPDLSTRFGLGFSGSFRC
jgi:hypothetical protein